jgi:hypothetical protein
VHRKFVIPEVFYRESILWADRFLLKARRNDEKYLCTNLWGAVLAQPVIHPNYLVCKFEKAPVAQLDRVSASEAEGFAFCRVCHFGAYFTQASLVYPRTLGSAQAVQEFPFVTHSDPLFAQTGRYSRVHISDLGSLHSVNSVGFPLPVTGIVLFCADSQAYRNNPKPNTAVDFSMAFIIFPF